MSELYMCTCCDCGYQWIRGQDGSHSCTQYFQKTIEDLTLEVKRLKKPPIGIETKKIWQDKRLADLTDAINRYSKAGIEAPPEWLRELHE